MTAGKPAILIVDDDPGQLAHCAAKLDALGYDVEIARSAEEGIAASKRKEFDLILTDNLLPGMSGLGSIPELRNQSAAPIFLMSSQATAESEKDAILLGARAYFSKPLDFQEVHLQFQSALLTTGRKSYSP